MYPPPQVKKAQKAIPTGLVYRQNEVTLAKIGCEHLEVGLPMGRDSVDEGQETIGKSNREKKAAL